MDYEEHYKQTYSKSPEKPCGWIQWKGTNACIDLHCSCGDHTHLDEGFLYYFECPKCKQVYALDPNVRLIPLDDENTKFVKVDRPGLIKRG